MKVFRAFILSLPLFNFLLPSSFPTEYNEFLRAKNSFPYVLTLLYKDGCPQLPQVRERIGNNETLLQKGVEVELVNLGEAEGFPDFFQNGRDCQAVFYIHGQASEMLQFDDWVNRGEDLEQQVTQFINAQLSSASTPFSTVEVLLERLERKKVGGVYLGPPDERFRQFLLLAEQNLEFPFFHSHDPQLAEEVFGHFHSHWDRKAVFLIVRDSSLVDQFDSSPLVPLNNFAELPSFFEMERLPKMRTAELIDECIRQFLWMDQILLVYLDGDSSSNEKFEELVSALPKQFVFLRLKNLDQFALIKDFVEEETLSSGEMLVALNGKQLSTKRFLPSEKQLVIEHIQSIRQKAQISTQYKVSEF